MANSSYGIVYKATFPNGKCYIGITTRPLKLRIREHIKDIQKSKFAFHSAIIKYGADNVVWEIIDKADSVEELHGKEIYWIDFYQSYTGHKPSMGYNRTLGGDGCTGMVVTEEARKKRSLAVMGEKNPFYSPLMCI